MKFAAGLATIAIAAGAMVVSTAGARGPASTPFPVNSASLAQQAQELVWKVELGSPFTAASLKQQRRSLCLLVERPRTGSVSGVVCVDQGRRGPKLVYMHVTRRGRGPAQTISASISRDGASGMTVRFDPTDVGVSYTAIRWQVLSMSKCHTASKGCKTLFPARPALAKLHVPQVVGCVASGTSLVYGGSTKVHDVALTFDDGPWDTPPPSAFLDVLEREHAVATFFEIGRQIAPFDPGGKYERRMLADGDMIGDHSWSHPDVATLPVSQQRFQLVQTIDAIRKATGGFTPCLWRPPYGDISPELVSLARSLGLVTVMWDVDPRDWSLPGVNAIYDNVVSNARNGAIVIQHFGGGPRYETVAALPREIDTLRARGYQFVTVAQMLGLRLIYK
jgi:peptidoglycan/xylan/chitin deacetylase (PgdA/CDA1 family)